MKLSHEYLSGKSNVYGAKKENTNSQPGRLVRLQFQRVE
jgi:hypothetical protein